MTSQVVTLQPVAPQAVVVAQQPTTVTTVTTAKRPYPENLESWSSGLFGCFSSNCGVFLMGCFFPCCLACKMASDMDENLCTPCTCAGLVAMRTKLRTRLAIKGSIVKDMFAVCCCTMCAICQMKHEMNTFGMD